MKIMVMGAGGQGGPVASILARDPDVTQIIIADYNLEAANRVCDKLKSPKVRAEKVDASSPEDVAKVLKGMDTVIDVVLPYLASNVMRACLTCGANYVNTAFDTPFWDELTQGMPLTLDKEFKEAGLTALLGCGMAPGILNVVVKLYADRLDTVESVKLRLGKRNTAAPSYSDWVGVWNPGWSPKQALLDCVNPAICFDGGEYGKVADYAGIEEWTFPEPVGKLLVSHHSHEEPYSIPLTLQSKGLKYCDFKYYVTAQAATLVKMGFASQEEVEVNGVKIKPLDLVEKLVPKPGNAFAEENPDDFAKKDETVYVSMIAEIKGKQSGEDKTYTVHIPNLNKPGGKLYELFGTSLVNVALPAVVGAKMISEGAEKGIIFAEQLDPVKFIERFKATGHPCVIEEL